MTSFGNDENEWSSRTFVRDLKIFIFCLLSLIKSFLEGILFDFYTIIVL